MTRTSDRHPAGGTADYDERYTSLYDKEAAAYDEDRFHDRRGAFDRDFKNGVILDILRGRGLLESGARVIDIAAGTGRVTHALAEHSVGRILALDISREMLEQNRLTLPDAYRGRVEYLHASMKEIPLPADSVDAAILASFLYLIPSEAYKGYTAEIARILMPTGILISEISNVLMAFNPKNLAHVLVHRHSRHRSVKSHIYPWEIPRLFPAFRLEETIGTTYPLVTSNFEWYTRYSRFLGRSAVFKNLGGKATLVLSKSDRPFS